MRESKRKKLDAKGWKIGTPKDFLGMSDEEESYVNLRLSLAEGLKTRRQAHGLTQIGLAQAIKSSQSRVAKMEAGDPTVSLDLLVKSLFALGASNRELAAIISRRYSIFTSGAYRATDPTRLFLKKSRTSLPSPVQSRSENALTRQSTVVRIGRTSRKRGRTEYFSSLRDRAPE